MVNSRLSVLQRRDMRQSNGKLSAESELEPSANHQTVTCNFGWLCISYLMPLFAAMSC